MGADPARRRLAHAWDVLVVLVDRDLKLLYKRSALGVAWALVNPLLQLLILGLVFRRVLGVRVEHYAAYAFLGILVWGWFQGALVQSAGLITGSRTLVRQPGFPLALLPFVTVGVRFFHFAVALPILLGLLAWEGLAPSPAWCALPLLAAVQFALTAGLAYPLAALNVTLRDTQHVIGVLLQLMMYVTPVFYSIEAVPASLRPWFSLNPMVPLLEAWRAVLLRGQWPDAGALLALAALAAALVALGRVVFARQAHRFVEEL